MASKKTINQLNNLNNLLQSLNIVISANGARIVNQKGHYPPAGCGAFGFLGLSLTHQAELIRLHGENKQFRMEREIRKGAAVFFVKKHDNKQTAFIVRTESYDGLHRQCIGMSRLSFEDNRGY